MYTRNALMSLGIATHLIFAGSGLDAIELYSATFPQFVVSSMELYGPNESGVEGSVKRVDAALSGHRLIIVDSSVKHAFTFTPAISLLVDCESADEVDTYFAALAIDGQALMPVDAYGFSRRFGWCTDRFGVSWQLNFA